MKAFTFVLIIAGTLPFACLAGRRGSDVRNAGAAGGRIQTFNEDDTEFSPLGKIINRGKLNEY